MDKRLKELFEQIDAAIFSGDIFLGIETIDEINKYIGRWNREISSTEVVRELPNSSHDAPAFPTVDTIEPTSQTRCEPLNMGMSKRFYAACAAMQGLLANPSIEQLAPRDLIPDAYLFADELIKQENSEQMSRKKE